MLRSLRPWLSGQVAHSPRTQVIVGTGDGVVGGVVWQNQTDGSIWKRLEEKGIGMNGWTGPQCPNATFHTPGKRDCEPFCFFRLDQDPYEYNDLAPALATDLGADVSGDDARAL